MAGFYVAKPPLLMVTYAEGQFNPILPENLPWLHPVAITDPNLGPSAYFMFITAVSKTGRQYDLALAYNPEDPKSWNV
jgi:hypothetical protein